MDSGFPHPTNGQSLVETWTSWENFKVQGLDLSPEFPDRFHSRVSQYDMFVGFIVCHRL